MERMTRFRSRILLLIFLLVLGFFAMELYDQQVIATGGNMNNATTYTTQTTVKAARGEILDRNGNVLVSNRASYDLHLNHLVLLSAKGTNQYLYELALRCRDAGIEYNEQFPVSKERPFTYTLDEQSAAQQKYFQTYLAYMGDLDSDITAPVLIDRLRDIYDLPAQWTDEEARLVIGIRYEMALRNCVQSMSTYIFITDASDEALSAVVELNVPGMKPEASTVREIHTPYAAHILGFVGPVNAQQWEYYKDIEGYTYASQVGQDGMEKVFEEYLHGVDGIREDTVDMDGNLISSRYIVEPKAGSNVHISLDINLQAIAEDQMRIAMEGLRNLPVNTDTGTKPDGADAEGCAVVAMDMTGQVLVCASYPTYDLNRYFEDYNEILHSDYNPLYNRALHAIYPPGSTFKMAVVVGAINSGFLDSSYEIYDKGKYREYESSGFAPSCLYYSNFGMSHENENAMDALRDSCNYYFYYLGDKMNYAVIDEAAKNLGLGEKSGIELYEEPGYRANEATKAKLYPNNPGFYKGDSILAAIGQSDNRFTPIQLCAYMQTLANEGDRYRATFLNRVVTADYTSLLYESKPEIISQMELLPDTVYAYKEGMRKVAHESGGTAYTTFKNYPISICAKTGTAQQGSGGSDHGAFVCFAPYDDPQIAIAIYGEKAGHGSSLAVIAKALLNSYFNVEAVGDVDVFENQLS